MSSKGLESKFWSSGDNFSPGPHLVLPDIPISAACHDFQDFYGSFLGTTTRGTKSLDFSWCSNYFKFLSVSYYSLICIFMYLCVHKMHFLVHEATIFWIMSITYLDCLYSKPRENFKGYLPHEIFISKSLKIYYPKFY